MQYYIGQHIPVQGCITWDISLRGKSMMRLESLLGFQQGRLSKGATIIALNHYPEPDEFDFAGFTQVATHRHQPLDPREYNIPKLKENVIEMWRAEKYILTKVIPSIEHNQSIDMDTQYPPGEGIKQWVVRTDKQVKGTVVAILNSYPHEIYQPKLLVQTQFKSGVIRKTQATSSASR